MNTSRDYYERCKFIICQMYAETALDSANNLQDSKVFKEDLIAEIINIIFGSHFKNENKKSLNVPGYDLIDRKTKRVIQVSATTRKEKVEKTLKKLENRGLNGYRLYFFFLDVKAVKEKEIDNIPTGIIFNSQNLFSYHDLINWVYILSNKNNKNKIKKLTRLLESEYGKVQKSKTLHYKKCLSINKILNLYPDAIKKTELLDKVNNFGEKISELSTNYRKVVYLCFKYADKSSCIGTKYKTDIIDLQGRAMEEFEMTPEVLFDKLLGLYERGIITDPRYNEDVFFKSQERYLLETIVDFCKSEKISYEDLLINMNFELIR